MGSPRAALRSHLRSEDGAKQLRYLLVSIGLVLIAALLILSLAAALPRTGGSEDYTLASVLTAAILVMPTFFANRRWVWRVMDRERIRSQVAVFWVASALGVLIATLLTFWVQVATRDRARLVQSVSVVAAQLAGSGLVWVGRYVVLDRWIFRALGGAADPPLTVPDEVAGELQP